MKRGGPLKRKTPLKSKSGLGGSSDLKRTPLKSRSKKRSKFMKEERVPLIQAMIEADQRCELGPILAAVGIDSGCTGQIEGLHERRKRSAGGSLSNLSNLRGSCNRCNGGLEDNPEWKDATGTLLVVREGDPEWHQLGSRNDFMG